MTTNEEQEYAILKLFVKHKIEQFNLYKLPQAFYDLMGEGTHALINNMKRDGFIISLDGIAENQFTAAGRNRYKLLQNKQRTGKIQNIAFWILFVMSFIAAFDVVLDWTSSSNNKGTTNKQNLSVPITATQDSSKVTQ